MKRKVTDKPALLLPQGMTGTELTRLTQEEHDAYYIKYQKKRISKRLRRA